MATRISDEQVREQALQRWNETHPDRALTIDLCRLRWESDDRAIIDYLDSKVIGHAFVTFGRDDQARLQGPYEGEPPL